MDTEEKQAIYQSFRQLVNMTPSVLEKWLQTPESKEVGWDSGDGESVGHKSGAKIIHLLRKKKTELTTPDYKHMQKVAGYIKRHTAQKPAGDDSETRWNYSLKNWGYDYKNANR